MAKGLGHDQPKVMLIICFVPYSVVLNFWAKVLFEPGIQLFSSHPHTMTELQDLQIIGLNVQSFLSCHRTEGSDNPYRF
jgi:hypothetical protein